MPLDAFLAKTHFRRVFFAVVALATLVALALRYSLPHWLPELAGLEFSKFLAEFLDSLVTSLLVTVIIGSWFFWLTPRIVREAHLQAIEPRDLKEIFEKAFISSDIWYFKGGTGRYLRARTIPQIAKWARAKSNTRLVKAIILDPQDEFACSAYAKYRNGTASTEIEGQWTTNRVQRELFATILTLSEFNQIEQQLEIHLTLSSAFSSFRIDLGSQYAIVTREARDAPAMRCDKGTFFYDAYRDEVVLSARCGKAIEFGRITRDISTIECGDFKDTMNEIGVSANALTETDIREIFALWRARVDPYAKT